MTTATYEADAATRVDAFHTLGTELTPGMTAEEALHAGDLAGWNLRKRPVFTTDEAGKHVKVDGAWSVLMDDPITDGSRSLGVVGNTYHVIQNEAHAAFLNALVDESGAHFETAGQWDTGKKVFLTMRLPGEMLVGGKDPVGNYLSAINSHDGNSSFTLVVSPLRKACQNMLGVQGSTYANRFLIRHTASAGQAVQRAREALDMTFAYLGEWQAQAQQLINSTMTQARFEEIIHNEFAAADDAPVATVTRAANKLETMEWLFAEACTQSDICGTAWAGFNALTEWFDHYSPVRGDDREAKRAANAISDTKFKTRALQLMLAG